MNLNEQNPVMIGKKDFELLKPYISRQDATAEMSLSAELNRALIINDDAMPPHVIRLNSNVKIQDQDTGQTMELSIVMPQHADIKQKKVSVLTPIAAALIGFRQGEMTRWKVPAGMKTFKIIEVVAPSR
jgi:regulator of nucleoside diphosphate kinase